MSALREAEAGSAEDLAVLKAALAGDPLSFSGVDPVGNWNCRVIKLGGLLPLTVYPQFRCTISEDSKGWLSDQDHRLAADHRDISIRTATRG